ncbi:MAG: hypothetical protein IKV82_01090 [Akkermansia sp.]|nr:hypothetical protein [Akkermansia sp.]
MKNEHTHPNRICWIDAARVIAILLVMQAHTPLSGLFNHDSEGGAVALFFLLSGFFAQRGTFTAVLQRLGCLLPFYIIWVTYGLLVMNHGFNFSLSMYWDTLLHGSSNGMWFILYLIYFTIIGGVALQIPLILRICISVALIAYGAYQGIAENVIHPCMNIYYGLGVYLLGQLAHRIKPSEWKHYLFPSHTTMRWTPACILIIILLLSALNANPIPSWLLIWVSSWAILGTAVAIDATAPTFGTALARLGESVVFVYAIHMATLRMMISAYLRFTGTMPSYMVSAAFILLLFVAASWFYFTIRGKWAVTDLFLFARWRKSTK